MEASVQETIFVDPRDEPEPQFTREVEGALPEGADRTAMMLRVDYLLQRIREEEARAEEVGQFTARRITMIQDHAREQLRVIENRVRWLKGKVLQHVPPSGEGMQREFGKKSLSLPHGKVGYRASPPTIVIQDEGACVKWARSVGIDVKVTETVPKLAIMSWIKSTGEIPDVVEYVDGTERVYVEPSKGES